METEDFTGHQERQIAIAMVTDTTALAAIASRWSGSGLFASKWGNVVGRICIHHFTTYKEAPGRLFDPQVKDWCAKHKDKDVVAILVKFCEALSDEYEQCQNSQFTLDRADEYFTKVKLTNLRDKIDGHLALNEIQQAKEAVLAFDPAMLHSSDVIHPLHDEHVIDEVFSTQDNQLVFKFSDKTAHGQFFGDVFVREGFIAFEAPDKTGKSFFLLELVYQALANRKKVALFDAGDMSRRQVLKRFYCRIANVPFRSTEKKRPFWPCFIREPKEVQWIGPPREQGHAEVVWKDARRFDTQLDSKILRAKRDAFFTGIRSSNSNLKVLCYPTGLLGVSEIASKLTEWDREGWRPDLVVIDYADILAPPVGASKLDQRDQINRNWIEMAGLRQRFHTCVVTASQTDTEAYDKWLITRRNFSGDKRKNAHVTAMYAINMRMDEQPLGVRRINCVVRREAEYNASHFVVVAGSFALCRPIMVSCLPLT